MYTRLANVLIYNSVSVIACSVHMCKVYLVLTFFHCSSYALWLQVQVGVKMTKPPKPDENFVKSFLSGSKCLSGVGCATTDLV